MSGARAISLLTKAGEPRVWSLIVTVFGDLARDEGAVIPGPVLSALTGQIGIRPEAQRVALFRLRKDDWITSEKQGRVSRYRLTKTGRALSQKATTRIYAPFPPAPADWHVLIAPPMDQAGKLALESDLLARGYVALTPGAFLGMGAAQETRADLFTLTGQIGAVPGWLSAGLMPDDLAEGYARFADTLAEVERALAGASLSPIERAALRVLIVHGWRRLVLRHADLPDGLFPPTWRGPEARRRVHDLLSGLGRPSLSDLESASA